MFKLRTKEKIEYGKDCKDYKPMLFSKACKYSAECMWKTQGYKSEYFLFCDIGCTGIKLDNMWVEDK